MNIFVFTDAPALEKKLSSRRITCRPQAELTKTVRDAAEPILLYVDLGTTRYTWEQLAALGARNKKVFIGVIDSKNKIKSPLPLVHQGLVDYISAAELAKDPSAARGKKVLAYIKKYRAEIEPDGMAVSAKAAPALTLKPVLHGWQDVRIGKEYTFSIMFVELDDREEMENRYGVKNLSNALKVFRGYVEKNAVAFGGKIWMWSHFGGVILFPFNAAECNAVLCGFRMVMYKFLHDAEESHFPNFISFRLALHLGNITYQEKTKGEIVSDSLNSVFHLGQKYAEPGFFYLTEDIFRYVPQKTRQYFKELGVYENRTIYRMISPVLSSE